MKNRILIFIFTLFILVSCSSNNDSTLIGKYKTEYTVYYGYGYATTNTIYSDKEIYTCSFQGTNFLLEKDNAEEILSTTAPIQIINSEIVK